MRQFPWGVFVTIYLLTVATVHAAGLHHHAATTDIHTEHKAHGHHRGHWTSPKAERAKRNPLKPTAATIERGKAIYQTHCASCHGARGEGDGLAASSLPLLPANLRVMVSHHSDGDLAWKIAEGRGVMPGWRNRLETMEIWSLVHYIRQLAKEQTGEAVPPHP